MGPCQGYQWGYLFTLKSGRQKLLSEGYGFIREGGGEQTVGDIVEVQEFQWITNIGLTKRNLEEMIGVGRCISHKKTHKCVSRMIILSYCR